MALIFKTIYTVPFDTTAGTDINWELDILRSYDDVEFPLTPPAWFLLDTENLVATKEPMVINYQKDWDVYKPIQGSEAKINLMVQRAAQYLDFNTGGPFEYQARLRYQGPQAVAGETLTATSTNVTTNRTNLFMSSADRRAFFGIVAPTGTYAEADADVVTELEAIVNGERLPLGTIIRVNSTRISVRGNFDFEIIAGTPFIVGTNVIGELQPFWCGYISPVEGNESVSTFPFEVSYTALDGLGLLEEATVPPINDTADDPSGIYNSMDDINLIDVLTYALIQTGLGLDLYVDTKIQSNGGDALINAVADAYSFYSDDRKERNNLKEAIEGILSTFNAKITQAKGRWYIYNASTHGGTGDTEIASWNVYDYTLATNTYVARVDSGGNFIPATEALRYNITGMDSGDVRPANNDLELTTRRPYGSVECKPQNLVARELVPNGGFELRSEGWMAHASSADQALQFSSAVRLEGERSITTNRSRFNNADASDVWFETVATGWDIDQSAPIEINIDWLGDILKPSGGDGVRNVLLRYQVLYVLDDVQTTSDLNALSTLAAAYNVTPYTSTGTTAFIWDFVDETWKSGDYAPRNYVSAAYSTQAAAGEDLGEWLNISETLSPPNLYYDMDGDGAGDLPILPGKLVLRVYYPRGNRPKGRGKGRIRGNRVGTIQTYIDNISIKAEYDGDVAEPTFERVQEDYTSTLDYEPSFASSTSPFIVQTLQDKEYNRTGKTEVLSVEEIGTQQKLNDYRSQFKTYGGTLINNTGTPLSAIDKVLINFDSVGYIETDSCIFNGGTFRPKSNTFDIGMYVPHQVGLLVDGVQEPDDIAPVNRMKVGEDDRNADGELLPGFYTEDIDLVPAKFPGRSTKVVYTLAFNVMGVDGMSNEIADGVILREYAIQYVGAPGDTATYKLAIEPGTTLDADNEVVSYIVNTSGAVVTNTENIPAPVYATFPTSGGSPALINYNGVAELPITITFPEQSEYEVLTMAVGLILNNPEVAPNRVPLTVNVTNPDPTNLVFSQDSFDASGNPGDGKSLTLTISPVDPAMHQTDITSVNVVGTTTITQPVVISGNGTSSTTIVLQLNVPNATPPTPYVVGIVGGVDDIDTPDNPLHSRTITFTGGTNGAPLYPEHIFRGNEGNFNPYRLTIKPGDDYFFADSTGVTLTFPDGVTYADGSTTDHVNNLKIDGQNLEADIRVETGLLFLDGEVVINNANAQLEPFNLRFVVTNYGLDGATITGTELNQRFDRTDFGQQIDVIVVTIPSTPTRMFLSTANETDVNIDEEQFRTGTGEHYPTLTDSEQAFTASPQPVVAGNASYRIAGIFPTVLPGESGEYVIPIDVSGEANFGPATEGFFRDGSLAVPLSGATVSTRVSANGTFTIDTGAIAETVVGNLVTFPVPSSATARTLTPSLRGASNTILDNITILQSDDVKTTTFTITNQPLNSIFSAGTFSATGLPGQSFARSLVISSTSTHEILTAVGYGIVESSGLITDGTPSLNSDGQVVIPFTIEIATGDSDITGTVTGVPSMIPIPGADPTTSSVTIGLNTAALDNAVTHNFVAGVITGAANTSQMISFDVTPPVGQELLNFGAVAPGASITDVEVSGSGSGNYGVTAKVNFPAAGETATIDIVLEGALQEEPHLMTVNVNSVGLDNAKVRQGTFSVRFGPDDYNDGVGEFFNGTVVAETINGRLSYSDRTDITATYAGGVAANGVSNVVDNNINIPWSFQFPTVPQDIVGEITLTGVVEPAVLPAITGRFGDALLSVPLTGGTVRSVIQADGSTNVVSGVYDAAASSDGVAVFVIPSGSTQDFSPQLRAGASATGAVLDGLTIRRSGDTRTTTLTLTNNVANSTLNTNVITVTGFPGVERTVLLSILPNVGYQATSNSGFGISESSDAITDGAATLSSGVITIPITIEVEEDNIDTTGTVTGLVSLIPGVDVEDTTAENRYTINTNGLAAGITHNFQNGNVRGEVNSQHELTFDISPPDGMAISGTPTATATYPNGGTITFAVTGSGDGNYGFRAVAPFSSVVNFVRNYAITVSATLELEPHTITIDIIDGGLGNAKVSRQSFSTRFGPDDFGDTRTFEVIAETIDRTSTYSDDDADDISVATTGIASHVANSNDLNGNMDITIPITYLIPSEPKDAGGTVTLSGTVEPSLMPATSTTALTLLGPALQAQGSSTEFLLVADGAWTARMDVRFGNVEDSDNSNGMFSRSYTVNGMTGTLSGSYSLTSGDAGVHSIIVTTGPLFYEVEIRDGNSNLFLANNVRYELRIFSGTTLVASASATQSADNGARTITYPGATVTQLMQAGQSVPTWTFQS